MPGDESTEFIQDWYGRRKDRISSMHAWETAMRAKQYAALSVTPEQLPGIFAMDPTKAPSEALQGAINHFSSSFGGGVFRASNFSDEQLSDLGQHVNERTSALRSDFVVQFEEAYYRHREKIPMDWWMQWSPGDLRLIGGEDFKEIAQEVAARQWHIAQSKLYEENLDAEVQRRIERLNRGRSFASYARDMLSSTLGVQPGGVPLPEVAPVDEAEVRKMIEFELRGKKDQLFDEDIRAWYDRELATMKNFAYGQIDQSLPDYEQEDMRKRADQRISIQIQQRERDVRAAIAGGEDPRKVLGTQDVLTFFIEGGLAGLSYGLGLAAGVGTFTLQAFDPISMVPGELIHGPYDWLKGKADEKKERSISEAESRLAAVDPMAAKLVAMNGVREAWDQLATENPNLREEYLRMGGFDPTVAFGFFSADVLETPEAEEQLSILVEDMRDAEKGFIRQMEEQNFSPSDIVMDGIAWYGHVLPNYLASFATIMLTDGDLYSKGFQNGFVGYIKDIHEEVRASDNTPSVAVGMDGSLAGLMLDLTSGIALDPVTWFTGARGSVKSVKASSMAEASALASHPVVTQMIDDAYRIATSPSYSPTALQHAISWMDDLARQQFLARVDVAPQTLKRSLWRRGRKGINAMEVKMDFINQLVPNKLPKGHTDRTGRFAKDVAAKGYEESIIVTLGRDGYIGVTDGFKRVGIARDAGHTHLPVKLRIVDKFDGKGPKHRLEDILPDGVEPHRPLAEIGAEPEMFSRIDAVIPRGVLNDIANAGEMKSIVEGAILRGAVPDGIHRSFVARMWNNQIRTHLRKTKPGAWISRYMTQQNIVTRLEMVGPGAMERLYDTVFRMWGDDIASADQFTGQIMEFEQRAARRNYEALQAQRVIQEIQHEIKALQDLNGGNLVGPKDWTPGVVKTWDENVQSMQVEAGLRRAAGEDISQLSKEYKQLAENRKQTQRQLLEKKAEFDKLYQKYHKLSMELPNTSELAKLITEMWDEFNRRHIATNKAWHHLVDPQTGIVPWEQLQKGVLRELDSTVEGARKILPEEMADAAKALDLEGEKLAQHLSNTFNTTMAVNVPLSPLDLLIASETGGARWIRFTQSRKAAMVRESALTFHMLWTLDKVFRLSTGVTVSFDELLRMVHIRGPRGALEWMYDRGAFIKARSMAALEEGISPFRREARAAGQKYLSPKAQERMRALGDFPTYLKQAERQFYDGHGLGWTDMKPGEVGYRDAAQGWLGMFVQDTGFQAFLKGREAFEAWFFSSDGARMRQGAAIAKDKTGNLVTRVMDGVDEAYKGWETMVRIMLKHAEDAGEGQRVLNAIKDTARKVEESGGRAHNVPEFVIDNIGPVRGVKKNLPRKTSVEHLTETFFDNFFMDPVNYRRGFLAEMTRQNERVRIEGLLQQQGKTIMPDAVLQERLGIQGLSNANRFGLHNAYNALAEKMGYVTESMVNDIVERAVWRELDNVLFTWDRGSRFGSQLKPVFPFGRPWADMAGFWGREMLRKPVLRGWVNESNFLGLKTLNDKGMLPNVRPAAMMSRLANTDFTIDKGWFGGGEGGLLPGSTSTDFSPLFFLPTKGENPLSSLIPGLGYVPMWALDQLLTNLVDPVKDPDKYMDILNEISDFIPGFRFQQGGFISRMLGGGSLSTAAAAVTDGLGLAGAFLGPGVAETFYGFTSTMGDITREVTRTREISSLLADEEELNLLLSASSPEQVELLLYGLALDADKRASGDHLARTIARWVVPADNRYDVALSDIHDVWVTASEKFPELSVRPDLRDADMSDTEIRRQFANDVRKTFFSLPSWKRDLMIAQYPQLAVNLVGSWEWTYAGQTEGLPGSDKSYRTGGSVEDIARHQYYVEQGYVRPVQPIERARRILGLMFSAKESAAKEAYSMMAREVNNFLWEEMMTGEELDLLEKILQTDFVQSKGLTTVREVWERWGALEIDFEHWVAEQAGIEVGEVVEKGKKSAWDKLKENVRLETKRWGESWPGLNPDEVAKRFQGLTIPYLTDEIKQIGDGLGMELQEGMTGQQFYNEILKVVTQVDNPVYSTVKASYEAYTTARSAAARAAENELFKAVNNPSLDEGWRKSLDNFMYKADVLSERWRDTVGGMPLAEQNAMVEQFNDLRFISDLPLNWPKIWEDRYASTYGPLEWEPPTPASPFKEDGTRNPNASAPFIQNIIDGDSIIVRDGAHGDMMTVRLLGVRARDYGLDNEGADADRDRLYQALMDAVDTGDTIWIVRDPDTFLTNTDHYGRVLAWLWIGDKPFYFEEDFRRNQTPSGGEQ